MPKSLVYYHRAYRKITGSRRVFAAQLLLITVPLVLILLWTYSDLTRLMSFTAEYLLSASFSPGELRTVSQSFLLDSENIHLLVAPGTYPSALMSFISVIAMLCLILALSMINRAKNVAIFGIFLAGIHLISAVFFTLIPQWFPYTMTDFMELYIKTIVCIWLFIPFILSMALLPLPAPFFLKYLLVLLTLVYSFVFATLRYAAFVYILSKFSFIYMALLFFAFGPLIDFVYIVGIYAIYTAYLAGKLKGNEFVWKWLY